MPDTPVTARFRYHGEVRHLVNPKVELKYATLIGTEHRKRGRFSYKTKRFKIAEMKDLSFTA